MVESEYIINANSGISYEDHYKKIQALMAERPDDYYYELVPSDYRWHFFNWDKVKSSPKLKIETDPKMKEMFGGMPDEYMPKN